MSLHTSKVAIATCVVSTALAVSLNANTVVWQGLGADANWLSSGNWVGVSAPSALDTLSFGPNGAGSNGTSLANNFAANTQFNGINYSDATTFTLTGNTIDLGGNVILASSVNQTINLGLNLVNNATFDVNTARTLTLGGALTGSSNFTKDGLGTVTLNASASSFTGTTYIKSGLLQLGTNGVLNPASTVVIGGISSSGGNGATLAKLNTTGTGGTTKDIAGVEVVPSTVELASARSTGSGTFTADLGLVTRNTGSAVKFTPAANSLIVIDNTNVNGILGGWATTGSSYAMVNGSGQVVAYNGSTILAGPAPVISSSASSNVLIDNTSAIALTGGVTTTGSAVITVSDTSNLQVGAFVSGTGIPGNSTIVSIDNGTQVTLSANATADGSGLSISAANPITIGSAVTDVNTIQMSATDSRTIDLGGNTLRLGAQGGVYRSATTWVDATNLGLKINNGTLTAGGADNTAGEIIFNTADDGSRDGRGNRGISVGAVIADNGTGVVTLTKTGTSTLELTNTNTYTGDTYLTLGRIYTTASGALGTGDVNVIGNSSQLVLGGGLYTNDIYISGIGFDSEHPQPTSVSGTAGALILNNGAEYSGTLTMLGNTRISAASVYSGNADNGLISGKITGGYNLEMGTTGNIDYGTITLSNTSNDWTGGLTMTLSASSGSRQSIIELGASEVIPDGIGFGDVNMNSGNTTGSLLIMMRGHDETINGLNSGGNQPGLAKIQNASATAAKLSVGGGNANGAFFGSLQDGTGGGALSLTKVGTGTQEIGGVNSYTGATAINGGVLLLSGTLTGTSGITINDGGTLNYTNAASLDRTVILNSGGIFKNNSSANFSGAITFNDGGVLSGTNWNGLGDLVIANGSTLSPGNSPGQAVGTDQTWANGGIYVFEINDALGASGINWDDVNFSGDLDVSGLTAGGFIISLNTLDSLNVAGQMDNFDSSGNYSWEFASFGTITGTISNSLFSINKDNFENAYTGTFSISQVGNSLFVNYSSVPEPSTYALFFGAVVAFWVIRRKRVRA